MALKQSSLNFDFSPDEEKREENLVDQSIVEDPIPREIPPLQEVVAEVEATGAPTNDDERIEVAEASSITDASRRGRRSLSEVNLRQDELDIPEDELLFKKQYYSIKSVADMFKVNNSLIRYWANEFDFIKPMKNGKGDRHFRPEDIKNLKLIYHLLRERKYTMEGAKDFLKKNKDANAKFAMIESLKNLKSFLTELKVNI